MPMCGTRETSILIPQRQLRHGAYHFGRCTSIILLHNNHSCVIIITCCPSPDEGLAAMKIEELSNDNRVAKDATGVRLAQRIRELRVERGLTLQEVSDAAGFSSGLLSKIENCIVSPPVSTLAKLAEA